MCFCCGNGCFSDPKVGLGSLQWTGWPEKSLELWRDVSSQIPCDNVSRWLLQVGKKHIKVGFFSQNVWIFYNAEEIFTGAHWSHLNMYHFLTSNLILPRCSQLHAEEQKATLEMPGIEASLFFCIACEHCYRKKTYYDKFVTTSKLTQQTN